MKTVKIGKHEALCRTDVTACYYRCDFLLKMTVCSAAVHCSDLVCTDLVLQACSADTPAVLCAAGPVPLQELL